MGQVLIRNIPDDVIETFKTKARLKGKSLEQELRDLIDANKLFTNEECLAIAREHLARFDQPLPALPREQLREGLDGTP